MKKLSIILLSLFIASSLLIGCGSNQKELNKQQDEIINNLKGPIGEMKEISEGEIYNEIEGVAQGSKSYLIQNKDNNDRSILIELNINEDNKEQSITDFLNKSTKIATDLEESLTSMRYKDLTILMYVNNKFVWNSVSFDVKENSLEHKDTKITDAYYDSFQKAKQNIK